MARILVIDDDCAVRTAIQIFLNYEGFEVIVAEDAAAGLEAVKKQIVDVVVLDIFMPKMNGLDAIKALRNWAPQLPIIAITGFLFRDSHEHGADVLTKAGDLGATAMLRKPFGPRQLTSLIRNCLETVDRPRALASVDGGRKPAVGLAVISPNLRFVRINAQLAKYNGVPQAEHIGREIPEIIPHACRQVEEKVMHVLRSGRPVEAFTLVAETARAPGVEKGWLEDYFPMKRADGTVGAVGVMVREISVSLARARDGERTSATPEHLLESGEQCLRMARDDRGAAVELHALGHNLRTRAVKRLTKTYRLRRTTGI